MVDLTSPSAVTSIEYSGTIHSMFSFTTIDRYIPTFLVCNVSLKLGHGAFAHLSQTYMSRRFQCSFQVQRSLLTSSKHVRNPIPWAPYTFYFVSRVTIYIQMGCFLSLSFTLLLVLIAASNDINLNQCTWL